MPYPEVFGGGRFFDKCSEEKNLITAVGSGRGRGEGGAVSTSQWGLGAKPQKILAI